MKKALQVEGMMCQHCVKHVKEALEKVEGVAAVEVSLEEKKAVVTMAQAISDESLKAAITEAGYEVTGIQGDEG